MMSVCQATDLVRVLLTRRLRNGCFGPLAAMGGGRGNVRYSPIIDPCQGAAAVERLSWEIRVPILDDESREKAAFSTCKLASLGTPDRSGVYQDRSAGASVAFSTAFRGVWSSL